MAKRNQSLGAEKRLKEFGILQYIDLVIASAEEGAAKPDKRIFEIALNRAACKPQQADYEINNLSEIKG